MTAPHPAPSRLVPYALGAGDPATAGHVKDCASCRTEVEALREAGALLRGTGVLDPRTDSSDCPDEFVIADFVEGRLTPQSRATAVAHLLTCARCRALVKAISDLAANEITPVEQVHRRTLRWTLPVGLAAAAVLILLLRPRGADDSMPGLREPTVTSTTAPMPITPAPGASVARVDSLVWSSVPKAEGYRVRLYDGEGSVLWTVETPDTAAAVPSSLRLQPGIAYFWRVEAQAEWMRWAASDLSSFRISARR